MHKALNPKDYSDRLHVSREEGRIGLASIEESIEASIRRLEDYREKCEERQITATRKNTANTRIKEQKWLESKNGKKTTVWAF